MNNAMNNEILTVKNLCKNFEIPQGSFKKSKTLRAVNDATFTISRGHTLGVVGETGCGKTTLARTIIRLHKPDSGSIVFNSSRRGQFDLAQIAVKDLRAVRPSLQYVFQDPYSSLNQRMNIRNVICEPLMVQKKNSKQEMTEKAVFYLEKVGLNGDMLQRYPHEFSGGQRQRIVLARALILEPEILFCDEPVSALDVASQAKTLNLFKDLADEFGLTYMFIAHDLSVVQYVSDWIVVMYLGKIVEYGSASQIYRDPKHPYTELLLKSIPNVGKEVIAKKDISELESEAPDVGCVFRSRCIYKKDICSTISPEKINTADQSWSMCHFTKDLKLQGLPGEN
ncbi:MAG: ABC transporter ATP-binding protein [Bacteroidetes bacterium]|nr:ABC transporter ATP-binding protein [Bacteroidota bacterium]